VWVWISGENVGVSVDERWGCGWKLKRVRSASKIVDKVLESEVRERISCCKSFYTVINTHLLSLL
jgi:hypothetical protein